ncbi:MAG: hypothetical protein ABUK01_08375, partial [Leptospirales bacterium]
KVFLLIHDKFAALVEPHIEEERALFIKELEGNHSYSINGTVYKPEDFGKAFEYSSDFRDIHILKKELKKPEYQKMMELLRK